MRVLLLLRGAPGCGKTTWIESNGLKPYTLSADDIRLLCQSPILNVDGFTGISQENDKVVWKTLFSLLETRMQRGEFTVIDATNSKTVEMNRYKDMCATYRYRIYCVDFTGISIEECKRRNSGREKVKQVPEEVIDRMYSRFKTQKIPAGISVINPDELGKVWLKPIDLSAYDKVHHIGDIHGCYSVLKEYFDGCGGIKENEFYIFTGDYIDRGIENADVIKFLMSIKDNKNVLMLEGNHEKWLWIWAHGGIARSKEFELITKQELEDAKIDKKDARQLYRKFGQCAYYQYGNKIYVVTHGGLSTMPQNFSLVATDQMINGVGSYNDFERIAETFYNSSDSHCYQIHGHRNTKRLPTMVNDRVFNLEGQVEFGGYLRCVQVDRNGCHIVETKNNVFKPIDVREEQAVTNNSVVDLILSLRNNKYIQEKRFENISSFNFTQKAFYDKVWNEQTIKARGLYLDTVKGKVAARAYNKFFNINEMPETKFDMLQYKLQFPVTAYVKENGFLGIVSYDEYKDNLFIASKSTIDSAFAGWFRDLIYQSMDEDQIVLMKNYLRENEVSFVFECIDVKHDPHIIDYDESKIVLLDIVKNDLKSSKLSYSEMCNIAETLGLQHKKIACEILSWQDFYDWYYEVLEPDYLYEGKEIEGFVIEDCNGFMTKLKLTYYNFWKFMRGVSHEAIRKGYISKTAALTTPLANQYYSWVRTLYDAENRNAVPTDICTLRRMFYKQLEN